MTQLSLDFSQRWLNRREHHQTPENRINPDEFGVEILPKEFIPRQFVKQHHYSGSYPAAHCAIGLFRKSGIRPSRMVGVAVFSEGVQSELGMPKWTGFSRGEGTELGRLVLLPEVAHNGESWFIARAFEKLRAEKPEKRVVLSYCDPLERTTEAGEAIKPGHFGCIYQATNALHVGISSCHPIYLRHDGRVLHPYAFYKAVKQAQGWRSAMQAIESAGGPRLKDESVEEWVARVKRSMRRIFHPGNLVYVFGLDTSAWRSLRQKHGDGLPYPKAHDWKRAA